ncbi:UDP-4-amino-4,6-dideoxy-N-acetyl-beta-L-altrosamine transaminase [Clostridium cavendishii DSM 21758]|uniref:UDP-4-amino-4,6-dideoxy-N-acetyl-beta-L-altrosamine transaminase n=1 Tax=Clostridium cavendishii DSM 21758 TaxID=1121302 RepID=A0A1M6QBX8_9CLOT|nr:UDP-4-amino-4,6-dideoxy-N-acetyl-beta-L-altrosamine transaminase [Clostridium cavendishii]SHK17752.1 UDP-4-amino-4,6-dideoxy-N-acetyl-beta-L-altrosamine transaminase [Clostridium cavendishii DSM 21758]
METLAILGGRPVRDKYLTYGRQAINEEDINSVVEVLKGDYLTTGPKVKEFEDAVAKYVNAKYAVAVCNGTAALHMACYAAGIKEGDEVIVSSLTFAASANCVLYCGGTPVFAEINKVTYNIDIEDIKRKITERTKAIIAVDYTGQPVNIDEIKEIAKEYNLIFIEDGAHSLGAEYKGIKVGTQADMTMFSFHPVKPITTGEGGIITTNNKEYYDRMLLFRSHGITRDYELMKENQGKWYYEQIDLGYNYRITDLQCALGISQIKKLDSFIARRRYIANIYNEAFSDLEEIVTPKEADFSNSGWHIYVIKLNNQKISCTRKEFFDAMIRENIGVNVHYMPVYLHPYYEKLGYKKGQCKEAEKLYDSIITLPLFPAMTDKDIEDVIKAVFKICNYYKSK